MKNQYVLILLLLLFSPQVLGQIHPEIYITNEQREAFLDRMENSVRVQNFIDELKGHIDPFVERHKTDPDWIVSRLQMYWNTKYTHVFVDGMDFSHGEGEAPVPTVRFSGSRDWATDYLTPSLEDIRPFMDDPRGLYLQNGKKEGQPWEWVHPSETGHIVEKINRRILDLAEEAAFLYWLNKDERYAQFASDIFMTYMVGMYHRNPPITVGNHRNRWLMGLQTFEVIHEGVVEPVTVCYDFLYDYLKETGEDLALIQKVFRKWADQEIKYGVPHNNWNMMQARFITYLALALESDDHYPDGRGQDYYIDQVLYQNSFKQKALKDVVDIFDPNTGIWPEVAHYSIMVSDDILEIYCLMDKTLNNNLLQQFPLMEKAVLANFNYLFPNGFTTAYGDAKHARLRFNSLELLIAQYRKYEQHEKEAMITGQLKRFMEDEAYSREQISSLFRLFFYVEELEDVPSADSFEDLVNPTFYSPNVSWIVQRNGNSFENGMMVSKNASLGNHSHTNGVNLELFAKGMVVVPDCAAGVSYWSQDHIDYYSRFPAHNTVIVDGISDYRNMRGTQAFEVNAIYPSTEETNPLVGDYTFSDVSFIEPSTDALQNRVTGTVRTSESSGYFIDIFRSSRNDGNDKKHEYFFHGQGLNVQLMEFNGAEIKAEETDQLSSAHGDLVGYDYLSNKREAAFEDNFIAEFIMPFGSGSPVSMHCWINGAEERTIFTAEAPYSRAIHRESVPESLYHKPLPTLIVRQDGEARSRPFVNVIEVSNEHGGKSIDDVSYFSPKIKSAGFVGINVLSEGGRVDHIYCHDDASVGHHFTDGSFRGNYAIVSFKNEALHSILLGHGRSVEKNGWKIQFKEKAGAVLVIRTTDGFIFDSKLPFSFTFPTEISGSVSLEMEVMGKTESFKGKRKKTEDGKVVHFELPAMNNTLLKLKHKP